MNALVQQRERLRGEIAERVAEGSRRVEQERSRLAALMSELTQSVVVCNLDGRVLLYNNRARLQFKALSDAPALAGGAELIGLGRSIYTVFDRQLVAHALENIQQRLAARFGHAVGAVRHRHQERPAAARDDGAGARRRGRATRRWAASC